MASGQLSQIDFNMSIVSGTCAMEKAGACGVNYQYTADFSCVRIFRGSVWFVRAIGNRLNLWHAQTIRFRRNIQTQVKFAVVHGEPVEFRKWMMENNMTVDDESH